MTSGPHSTGRHVAVIGGGIAGLATAFALHEQAEAAGLPLECTILEAALTWGGKILTHRVGDLLIEAGPDSFLSQKSWGLQLCEKLGLADRVINTNEQQKATFVYSRGRLRPLPEGLVLIVPTKLGPFFRSGLVSWAGIVRMGMDLTLPARPPNGDESLAAFFTRRLGREAFERLVEPLMAGIYAGDAGQMSLRATFPRFSEIEQRYGSLIRGMLAERNAAGKRGTGGATKRTMFVTLRGGVGELIEALLTRLRAAGVTLRSGVEVTAVKARPTTPAGSHRYEVHCGTGTTIHADSVVLATPAFVSSEFVRPLSPEAAGLLDTIPYASTATVSLAYASGQVSGAVTGFGFVVPRVEQRALLAATWTSSKWPHRAPSSQTLIRCYVGGVGREEWLKTDDATLVARIRQELRDIAGLVGEPQYVEVKRWDRGMPQYTLGHLDRVDRIQLLMKEARGLFLAGAAYRGVGIPDCIRDGNDTAAMVLRYLKEGGR